MSTIHPWRCPPAVRAFLGLGAVVLVVVVLSITWPGQGHHQRSQGRGRDEGQVQVMRAMFKATEDSEEDGQLPPSCPQSNAFDQLQELWRLSKDINSVYAQRRGPLEDIRWFRYQVQTHRNSSKGLLLTITEYHPDPGTLVSMAAWDPQVKPKKPANTKLVPTTGGSSFHVQWDVYPVGSFEDEELYDWVEPDQWLSKTACSVTDHFNGQYTVCCRPPAHATYGISKLTILADYINYEPFQSIKRGKPRQVPILSTTWLGREAVKAIAGGKVSYDRPLPSTLRGWPACQDGMSQLSLQGEWMAMDGAYRWADTGRRCVTPVMTNEEALACYTRDVDSLTMMGDSHLRQMANWYYGYFGVYQIKQGEIDSAYVPKVRFLWTTTGMNLAQRMQYSFYNMTLFLGRPLTRKDILVLDTAHWDLWETEVTPFTQVALPTVAYTIQRLRDDPLTKGARIIWLTSFPMPPQNDGGFRNGYTALAADGYMVPQLEKLGVELLHILPVIRARAKESVDDHHWNMEVNHEGQFELNFRTGQVGRELDRMLTKKICELPQPAVKSPMNLRSVLVSADQP